MLLLLWCLPCVCSASGVLDATNDTSPTGSLANGTFFAVPCCGGSAADACATWAVAKNTLSAAAAVLDSNAWCNLGSLDGVNYGIMPPYGSLNPPKFVWVVVFLTSAFLSIWLGGLQQFLQQKHKRAVKRKAAKSRKAIKRTHVDFAPNHHRRMCSCAKLVPCRYVGRLRLKLLVSLVGVSLLLGI